MRDAPVKNHFQLHMSLGSLYRWKTHGGFCFSDLLNYFPTHLLLPREQLEINVPSEFIQREKNRENEVAFSLWCHQPATGQIQHPHHGTLRPPSPP